LYWNFTKLYICIWPPAKSLQTSLVVFPHQGCGRSESPKHRKACRSRVSDRKTRICKKID